MKKFTLIFLSFFFLFILIGCSSTVDQTASDILSDVEQSDEPDYSTEDLEDVITSYDLNISITSDGITASSDDVLIDDNTVTISEAGTYELSGTATNIQIIVDAADDADVIIAFNGVTITSSIGPIINVINADKVILNVEDGTSNTLTDASTTAYENQAVIYSKDDLTINGTGTLTIDAGLQKGVKVNDDFTIVNTTLYIETDAIGIDVHNAAQFKDATITINADADGIQDNNPDDTTVSILSFDGGSYTITAGGDAISSAYQTSIFSGIFNLTTTGSSGDSSKGIKSTDTLAIFDGTFTIDSDDDGLHSNSSLYIETGTFTIDSGDDGIHADETIVVLDGNINITRSYEGIEALSISIAGGNINIVASDDGINGAGGYDNSGSFVWPTQISGGATFTMSGGNIYIIASGDGIDINGSIDMSGGVLLVDGPSSSMDGAIDYDSSFSLTGGIIVATGASGMAMNVSSSTITSVLAKLSVSTTAAFQIRDANDNVIVTFNPTHSYSSILIASSALSQNTTYYVYTGISATTFSSNYYGETASLGGSSLLSFTATSTLYSTGIDGASGGSTQPTRPGH